MRSPDIDRTVEAATEGLKDDRELRLDVRQELISHIEDSAAERRAQGMEEQESIAESLKAFGPSTDIAAELVSANRSRMRMRQLVRLAMRALLVPASLAVAFWIYADTLGVVRTARRTIKPLEALSVWPAHEDEGSTLSRKKLTDEQEFILFGDRSLKSDVARQHSIWESDPTNRVFYGNYITMLVAKEPPEDQKDLAAFEKEIRRGEALDPDNARYNYLLAGVMLDLASELEIVKGEDGKDEKRRLDVSDRELLDRAMAELLKGSGKSFSDTYACEMQALRFDMLPEVSSMVELIGRVGFAAGMLLPDISRYRNLARASTEYAKLLIAEGREKEAVPYLMAWYPMAKNGFEDNSTLIETLVSFAIVREGSNSIACLQMIGEEERAAEMSRKVAAVVGVYNDYRASLKSPDNDIDDVVMKHGSILHSLLLPALGSHGIEQEDLAPGRYVEQTILEKGWLAGFTGWLLFVMLCLFLLALYLRFDEGGASAPLLLVPDAGQMLHVVAYSVLIPLAVFYIYTRHTDLAGRDLSMRMWPRFVTELHLLTVVMLSVAAYQVQKYVDKRCRELGLETPGIRKYVHVFLFSLVPVGLVAWLASGKKRSAMFRGTIARSLIPLLALIIVIVGSLVYPYLIDREKRYVRDDGILGLPKEGGFTRIETQVTERLNRLALEAMEK